MKAATPYTLERQYLRLRLQANRLLLAQGSPAGDSHDDVFPRSVTMRLLTRTPGLAGFLLTDVAPFLLGRYLAKPKRGKKSKED